MKAITAYKIITVSFLGIVAFASACNGHNQTTTCGNGFVEEHETCDDSNQKILDGCNQWCQIETGYYCSGSPSQCHSICGDGVIASDEICDDGSNDNFDGCNEDCNTEQGWQCNGSPSQCFSICGDGLKVGNEQCDDGNSDPCDGCLPVLCQLHTNICNDGYVCESEQCDDGNYNPCDGCLQDCTLYENYCGDWLLCGDEECDNPTNFNDDDCNHCCRSNCLYQKCGDGIVDTNAGEACDDGNTDNGDGCENCEITNGWECPTPGLACNPVCGDGVIIPPEECDQAQYNSDIACDNCCRHSCRWQSCGDNILDPGENCDAGTENGYGGCTIDCEEVNGWTCYGTPTVCIPVCGDSIVLGDEECDMGHENNDEDCNTCCRTTCTLQKCGDGIVDYQAGEACDDGSTALDDGCDHACRMQIGWTCPSSGGQCETICGDGLTIGIEACDDGNDTYWDGCNDCHIADIQINRTTTSIQRNSDIAVLSTGSVIVVWESWEIDGDRLGIALQKIDGTSLATTTDVIVNQNTTGDQYSPRIASNDGDSFVVVWTSTTGDGSGTCIKGRVYDDNLLPFSNEFLVNAYTSDNQENAHVSFTNSNAIMVIWESFNQDSNGDGIYARLFTTNGQPLVDEIKINDNTNNNQFYPRIISSNSGEFIAIWVSRHLGTADIFARKIDSNGVPQATESRINTSIAGTQTNPDIIWDGGSLVFIAWQNSQTSPESIFGQFTSSTFEKIGEELQLSNYSGGGQQYPSISQLDKHIVVTWTSENQDGSGSGCFMSKVERNSSIIINDTAINSYTINDQNFSRVMSVADNLFIVVWQSFGQDGDAEGIYAKYFDELFNPIIP